MGQFAIPLMIASAAFSAYGAYSDAANARTQAKAQAQIARNNAIVAENNAQYEDKRAKDALDRGNTDANNLRRRVGQVEGTQRAAFAGGGVSLDSDSPLDILSDTVTLGQQDVGSTLKNAQRESYGYRMGAYNYRSQGNNFTASANAYQSQASGISPIFSAFSSALGSSGNISSKWNSFGSQSFNPSAYASGLPWSDIALKENIRLVGTENGHRIYNFNYIGFPIARFIGVMAHEVRHIAGAVLMKDGFLCVDYSKIGVKFRKVVNG